MIPYIPPKRLCLFLCPSYICGFLFFCLIIYLWLWHWPSCKRWRQGLWQGGRWRRPWWTWRWTREGSTTIFSPSWYHQSFKVLSILRSQIENAHLEAIIVADRVIGALRHAGSQYSHCQVEKNSMINPLSMLALSPAKKLMIITVFWPESQQKND